MRSLVRWILAATLASCASLSAQPRAIDTQKSVLTVRVYRSGIFSVLAHDHEIAAPIAGGSVDAAAHRVTLRVDAGTLRVLDSGASDKDRNEIQRTMLSSAVLDATRNPEIAFEAATVEGGNTSAWRVRGNLTLHGVTQPVTVDVSEKAGHYLGNVALKQTAFGMKPLSIAGGTVKVKDEVRVEFDIQVMPESK